MLFHVTADTRWSDLPLSGTFVDMLRRIVALAGATATATEDAPGNAAGTGRNVVQAVPPTRVLDGFGAFSPPPPTARPVPAGFTGRASADHPPGFYGPPEGLVASTRWRPPTGRCRSMCRRSMRGSTPIASANRSICAARCSSPRCCCC